MDNYDDAQSQQQMPYYPSGSNVHAANMVELTNPENILNDLELAYKGKRRHNGQEIKYGRQIMNDDGCISVMSQLKSVVNQVIILSWLRESQINSIMMSFSDSLVQDLMINKKKYAIQNDVDRTKILTMAQSVAYACLMRSREGNDKGFWSKISMEINSWAGSQQQSGSNSILSKFNPFKQ